MQTSGKVYDVYDDHGALLRGESLSSLVKTGQALSQDQLDRLPDSVFALVVRAENGDTLRKYACIDPGNTELALRYFAKIAESLPLRVREQVAENLKVAAQWYGLEEAEFTKTAFLGMSMRHPVSSVMRGVQAYDLATNVPKNIKSNMAAIKAMEGGGNVVSPEQVHTMKTGSTKEASLEKRAYALPSASRYPLETRNDLYKAAEYFTEHVRAFRPAERREYAVSFVKRAEELGVSEIPESIQAYAGTSYADVREIKMAMDARTRYAPNEQIQGDLTKLFNHRELMSAEKFASVLAEIDNTYGLTGLYDTTLPDPYVAVLSPMKLAADEAAEWTWVDGPHYVTGARLQAVAANHFASLSKAYGEDFAKEFQKDPVNTFKSLPLPHKRLIANYTSQQSASLV